MGTSTSRATPQPPPPSMADIQWYHFNISKEEAEALLSNEQEGTYLLRDSASRPGEFTVSVRTKKYGGRPWLYHFPACRWNGRMFTWKFEGGEYREFATVQELATYFDSTLTGIFVAGLSTSVKLKHPFLRSRTRATVHDCCTSRSNHPRDHREYEQAGFKVTYAYTQTAVFSGSPGKNQCDPVFQEPEVVEKQSEENTICTTDADGVTGSMQCEVPGTCEGNKFVMQHSGASYSYPEAKSFFPDRLLYDPVHTVHVEPNEVATGGMSAGEDGTTDKQATSVPMQHEVLGTYEGVKRYEPPSHYEKLQRYEAVGQYQSPQHYERLQQ